MNPNGNGGLSNEAPLTDLTGVAPDRHDVDKVRSQLAAGAERVPVIVQVGARWRPEAALRADEAHAQRSQVEGLHERAARRAPGARVVKQFEGMPGRVLEVTAKELDALAAAPEIATIHPVALNKPSDSASNQPIRATHSQQIGWTGKGQNVAIIDSGVARSHEYLGGRVVSEACFAHRNVDLSIAIVRLGACPNGLASQTGTGAAAPCGDAACDHGTHVAGIAAGADTGRLVNGSAVGSGVAPEAGIIAVQVFGVGNYDCNNDGSVTVGESCMRAGDDDLLSALDWVYQQRTTRPIASVNMSLGSDRFTGACDTQPHKPFIDKLAAAGISTVIAAGNQGFRDAVNAPGCISTAITVGGTDNADGMYAFTNTSATMDLWAPGVGVRSSTTAPAGYGSKWGTSMAAPHVAGAIALLKQIRQCDPGLAALRPANITNVLRFYGKPVTDTRPKTDQLPAGSVTAPRLDIYRAIWSTTGSYSSNNEILSPREIAGGEGRITGDTNRCATKDVFIETVEPHHAGNIGGNSLWYRWTAPVSGSVQFTTRGSTFDTLLAAYRPALFQPWFTVMAQNDDAFSGVRESEIAFTATAGQEYFIAVDGFRDSSTGQPAWGTVTLEWTANRPLNDDFAAARTLTGDTPSTWGDSRRSTTQFADPPPSAPSVWFKWTASGSGPVTVATTGSGYDTVLDVYHGTAMSNLMLVASDDDGGPGTVSLASFTAAPSTTYFIRLRGYNGATGDYKLHLRRGTPGVAVDDVTVKESAGVVRFRVSLDGPSAATTRVTYATTPETATPLLDYTPKTGTVTFEPGQLEAWVEVQIVLDVLPESSETFRLDLSNPVGLWVARNGRATILNTTYGAI